jgi:transcriptional regulator with XRE-family HTH domain
MMTPLSIRIRELRDLKSWSQAELARRSKVPQSTISRIEAGATPSVNLDNLEKLAKALGCDPGYLIVKKGG